MGQAGDAGEGTGGTDRSNIAELLSLRSSYPLPYDKFKSTFLDNSDCKWPLSGQKGEEGHEIMNSDDSDNNGRDNLDPLLNNAAASFRQGLVCCPKVAGTYNLVSTRNNNFTNRSQKLHIVVKK